ncbi:DUF982 domain-containing protein [Phyllobacterium chamaecytisi]|uniref:DUF982 domain-containing protein n=1 Tax=Phyllobacterium chamaecytisi TaxID=2876082 RepID=UPI001CD03C51|nr:DUF982 domain-containing protein [Phyllobacterium sp. KW56]MBZ9600780.1 DUF982 domain-containing protein [Phyllobacterium sp. KW56]
MEYETYRAFSPVTVMSRRPGQMINIGTAYDAAKFLLEEWPPERGGPLVLVAMQALHDCLAGQLAPAIARVAFIEAARQANIYVPPAEIDPVTAGRPSPRWRKSKPRRKA